MPTVIDQRLASRYHLWQIASVAAADRLAARVGRVYARMVRELAGLAGGTETNTLTALQLADAERTIAQAQSDARHETANGLNSLIGDGHRRAVRVLLSTVPLAWFAKQDPRLAWLSTGGKRTAEAVDPLNYEYEYEPIVPWKTAPLLAREEALALIEQYLFPPPLADKAREWLTYEVGGLTWDDRFRRYDAVDRDTILNQLTAGIADGENVSGLRKRLVDVTDGVTYRAQRIARTEGRRVAELAQQDAVGAMGDLVSGQQIVAVMDQWTRPEHALRNGKVYDRQDNGSFVADDGELLPQCPYAPNCRCTAVPVLAPPEEFLADPALMAEFQTATGDAVPDPSAYTEWFRRAGQPEREAAVGVRRYRTMARELDREPDWMDFVGPDGRLIPPKVLAGEGLAEREARREAVLRIVNERQELYRQVYGRGFLTPPKIGAK